MVITDPFPTFIMIHEVIHLLPNKSLLPFPLGHIYSIAVLPLTAQEIKQGNKRAASHCKTIDVVDRGAVNEWLLIGVAVMAGVAMAVDVWSPRARVRAGRHPALNACA